jgi:hypothetical protein
MFRTDEWFDTDGVADGPSRKRAVTSTHDLPDRGPSVAPSSTSVERVEGLTSRSSTMSPSVALAGNE